MEGERKIAECKTLELPNNGNQKGVSCIREGFYEVVKCDSPSKGECFKVLNVPGRSDILIHRGNFAASKPGGKVDTQGCILPGTYFTDLNGDNFLDIAESTRAMSRLLLTLPGKFTLYII